MEEQELTRAEQREVLQACIEEGLMKIESGGRLSITQAGHDVMTETLQMLEEDILDLTNTETMV